VLRAMAILAATVVAVAIPACWVMGVRHGAIGVSAAAIAAGVCWVGAGGALLLTALLRDSRHAVSALLGGMVLRLALPLVTGLVLSSRGGELARAGVFGLIVLFYLLTLVVETLLSLQFVKKPQKPVRT
jgi:hypothetical protein